MDDSPGYDWPAPEPRRPRYRDEPSVSYDWPRQETPARRRCAPAGTATRPGSPRPGLPAGRRRAPGTRCSCGSSSTTLTRPGHAEWFRQHRSDPGYASWRAGADAAAARNPDLRAKLDELDRNLGAALSGPADANYLPPDVRRADAVAPEGGSGWTIAFLLVGVPLALGGGWYLVARRQRRSRAVTGPTVSGVAASAGNVVRRKLGVERDEPRREPFRIGQVVDLDATDFLLGEGKLLSKAPPAPKDAVTAIGRLDGLPLTRLYFGDDRFLQVHLSDAGKVDECRLFNLHDTVVPDGTDGWLFWIPPGEAPEGGGPNEWSIGYPVFDTKDGTRWERVWSPGENLVEPFRAVERIEAASGTKRRTVQTMLYAPRHRRAGARPGTRVPPADRRRRRRRGRRDHPRRHRHLDRRPSPHRLNHGDRHGHHGLSRPRGRHPRRRPAGPCAPARHHRRTAGRGRRALQDGHALRRGGGDRRRQRRGGIVLGGSVVSLAIPLAATLASHGYWLDILVWGLVALVLQLGVFAVLFSRKRVREGIARRNVAMAVATVGGQLAFAAVNAGAMLG